MSFRMPLSFPLTRSLALNVNLCARALTDAWLVKLQNVSDADVAKLMDHAAYEKHCKDSAH